MSRRASSSSVLMRACSSSFSPALRLWSFCKMETAWLTMFEMFVNWASKVAMRAAPAFCASASDAAMFSRSAAILGSCKDCAPRDFVTR